MGTTGARVEPICANAAPAQYECAARLYSPPPPAPPALSAPSPALQVHYKEGHERGGEAKLVRQDAFMTTYEGYMKYDDVSDEGRLVFWHEVGLAALTDPRKRELFRTCELLPLLTKEPKSVLADESGSGNRKIAPVVQIFESWLVEDAGQLVVISARYDETLRTFLQRAAAVDAVAVDVPTISPKVVMDWCRQLIFALELLHRQVRVTATTAVSPAGSGAEEGSGGETPPVSPASASASAERKDFTLGGLTLDDVIYTGAGGSVRVLPLHGRLPALVDQSTAQLEPGERVFLKKCCCRIQCHTVAFHISCEPRSQFKHSLPLINSTQASTSAPWG